MLFLKLIFLRCSSPGEGVAGGLRGGIMSGGNVRLGYDHKEKSPEAAGAAGDVRLLVKAYAGALGLRMRTWIMGHRLPAT